LFSQGKKKPGENMTTQGNMKEAFAGESQANRKYLAFAEKAEQEMFKKAD
jgi:rubrerythrin